MSPSPILGPTPTPGQGITLDPGPDIGSILLMILYLVLILVGVYYATRLFARLAQRGPKGMGKNKTGHSIRMIDRWMFDRERGIVIIEEDGKRYLLGVTTQSITLLRESDAPPPTEEDAPPPTQPITFRDMLATFKERGKP